MKHVHAEVIKAWADGAEIEVYDRSTGTWNSSITPPTWSAYFQYRVKPEPKPDVMYYAYVDPEHKTHVAGQVYISNGRLVKDDANLCLTYDGETGKLKKVELI